VAYVHVPALLHVMVFAFTTSCAVHAVPHFPQLVTVRMFVSLPPWSGVQCSKPLTHLKMHFAFMQVGVAFSVPQTLPHCPQLRTSSFVERQNPPQHVPPVPHEVPSPVHGTAHLPLGLHLAAVPASAQSPSPMQSTQRWVVVLQRWPSGSQSAVSLHPTTHWFFSLQTPPAVHVSVGAARHSTHVPAGPQ
jgi:hypothetical protein